MSTEQLFSVLTYDYNKVQDVIDIPANYQTINNLVTPSREQGLYEYRMSLTYTFDQADKSVYSRFSIDGGATWTEHIREPKDKPDNITADYFFPKEHPGGQMSILFEMKKEDSAGTLSVGFSDVIIARVG